MRLTPTIEVGTDTPGSEGGGSLARQVAAEVRAEIARQGTSPNAFAARIGWPQARLWRRLTPGETWVPLSIDELADVAAGLGVPVTQLIPQAPRQST